MAKRNSGSGKAQAQGARADELDLVRELARIAIEFDLSEVDLRPDGRVRVARAAAGTAAAVPPPASGLHLMPPAPAAAEAPQAQGRTINSPFVGTFYRAPSPDASPFVDVGQTVRKGQVVCIVEAMKLMNEIESEFDGKVAEILVKNGAHVEYGQALIRVE